MMPPSADSAGEGDGVLSFWTDAEMLEGAEGGGSSRPAVSQPAIRIRARAMGSGNRRIWTSGQSVSESGAPKMRLPRVHLQHTSSLK
jgi:hypothetical protein